MLALNRFIMHIDMKITVNISNNLSNIKFSTVHTDIAKIYCAFYLISILCVYFSYCLFTHMPDRNNLSHDTVLDLHNTSQVTLKQVNN